VKNFPCTPTGGAVIAVHKHDADGGFIYFIELDSAGNVLWCNKAFRPGCFCEAGAITVMGSGGYALAMSCLSSGVWIGMLDSKRVLQWQNGNAPSFYPRLFPAADDSFIISDGAWFAKFAADGGTIWQVSSPTVLKSIQQTRDGGYIVAGALLPPGRREGDIMVAKLNTAALLPGCDMWSSVNNDPTSIDVQLRAVLGLTGLEMQFDVNDALWSRELETAISPSLTCFEIPPDNYGDGIPETEEKGPDGIDAAYDGNNDGVPDCEQEDVASFHVRAGSYVTLASSGDIPLHDVSSVSNPAPVEAPRDINFAYDFLSFRLEPVPVGGAATVTLYLPDGAAAPDAYYKYGAPPLSPGVHWYEFDYDGQTGAEINGNTIVLHFIDGQRGDDDLLANGVIMEPGGPGYIIPTGDYDHDCDVDGRDLSFIAKVLETGVADFADSFGTCGCE